MGFSGDVIYSWGANAYHFTIWQKYTLHMKIEVGFSPPSAAHEHQVTPCGGADRPRGRWLLVSQLIPIDMKHSAAAMRFEEKGSNPEESGQNRRFLGPVPEHGPSEPPAGNGPVPAASGESLFHAMRPPFEVEAKTGGPEEEPDICDSLEAPWQEVQSSGLSTRPIVPRGAGRGTWEE